MPDLKDLELVVQSKVPLVLVESYEEVRGSKLVSRIGISRALGQNNTQGGASIQILAL